MVLHTLTLVTTVLAKCDEASFRYWIKAFTRARRNIWLAGITTSAILFISPAANSSVLLRARRWNRRFTVRMNPLRRSIRTVGEVLRIMQQLAKKANDCGGSRMKMGFARYVLRTLFFSASGEKQRRGRSGSRCSAIRKPAFFTAIPEAFPLKKEARRRIAIGQDTAL